jgi:hypothetical protein
MANFVPKKRQSIHAACQHIPQETDLAQELIDERRVAALTGLK